MKVLLISDMLKDFAEKSGALYCGDECRRIVSFIREKISEYKMEQGKVIYLNDAHAADDKEFRMFKPHAVKGTDGARVIDELKPGKDDIVIEKRTYSAFHDTRLEKVLKKLKPEEIGVVGVCTSICIMEAVGGMRIRGYRVVVYKDGVADLDRESHEFALKRMKSVYGAEIA